MAELLFRQDPYLKSCEATVVAVHGDSIELDRTVFYPLGGGQAGDTGRIGQWRVLDTRKGPVADQVLHVLEPGANLTTGSKVETQLDWERRHRLMRLHTALHLMSCVIVAPVSGGNIAPDKARLDFDIDMSLLDAERIERETNALISSGVATETVWITDEELEAQPDLVKTMSVQPPRGAGRVRLLRIPGIDLQPCGGTHVANIAEIGAIRVLRIRSEGKHNKRVTLELA